MSCDGVLLVDGELPLEGLVELLRPVRIGGEGVTRHGLARGVELEQLLGHVAHRLLDARLRLLPGRAAELVERRLGAAGVLLNEIEPLDRDEELVFAVVAKLHELLDVRTDFDPLQPDEHADAVIDMDDEVADLEVAEVRQERARRRAAPLVRGLALLFEDVRLGPDLEAASGRRKPFVQMAVRDEDRRRPRVLGAIDRHGEDFVLGEQFDRALGAAVRVGDEEDDLAALARAPDLGDPVADPAAEVLRRLRRDVLQARLVLDRQRLERDRAFEPRRARPPRDDERLRLRHLVALRDRFLVAGDDLLGQLLAVRVHFVRLGDEHAAACRAPRSSRTPSRSDRSPSPSDSRSCSGTMAAWSIGRIERCVAGS